MECPLILAMMHALPDFTTYKIVTGQSLLFFLLFKEGLL